MIFLHNYNFGLKFFLYFLIYHIFHNNILEEHAYLINKYYYF